MRDLGNKIGLALQPVFVSKKLEQDLKKPSRQLLISNALFIVLYVIWAMQIMSAIQPDTFFNVSLNIKIRQLASIFMKRMVGGIVWMRVILRFWESVKANSIV